MGTDFNSCLENKIEVRNFGCRRNGVPVLTDCNFTLHKGELTVICGPNGAGKSTLMTLMAGIIEPGISVSNLNADSGIYFNGVSINNFKRKALSQRIAFLSQTEHFMWSNSVFDTVLTGRFSYTKFSGLYSKQDYSIAEKCINRVQITELRNRDILQLSGGELQKVRIARALCQQPELLLLDEPVANLDFSYETDILKTIKEIAVEKNMAVLVSIHNLNLAVTVADQLILLPKAQPCITGTPENLITESILKKIYNCNFTIYKHPVLNIPQVTPDNFPVSH